MSTGLVRRGRIALALGAVALAGAAVVVARDPTTQPTTQPATAPTTRPTKSKPDPTQPATRSWTQWSDYHKRYVERARDGKKWPVDLVFFGDSITEWWPWEDFKARYQKPYHAANFGIGGDQVQNVLWRVLNGELDGISPKVTVLLIGTNNLGENSAEEIAAGITKTVEAIHQKSPTTQILLIGIFPRSDYAALRNKAAAVNAIISKLDDEKTVRFADIGRNFLNADGSVKDGVLKDKLHLTREGYEIWHTAMEPMVREMLGLPATQPTTAPTR